MDNQTLLCTVVYLPLLAGFIVWRRLAALRRSLWVAVRPPVERAGASRLPEGGRRLLEESAGALADLGFTVAEVGHTDRFSAWQTWSQVLFVNRSTGDRASVLGSRFLGRDHFQLIFATEFADGHAVTTAAPSPVLAVQPQGSETAAATAPAGPAPPADLAAVYARHRGRVLEATAEREAAGLKTDDRRVLPAPGDELRWLRSRANIVAANVAAKMNFVIDRSGRYYLPRWPAVLKESFSRRKRGPVRPAGFEVVLPPAHGDEAI